MNSGSQTLAVPETVSSPLGARLLCSVHVCPLSVLRQMCTQYSALMSQSDVAKRMVPAGYSPICCGKTNKPGIPILSRERPG